MVLSGIFGSQWYTVRLFCTIQSTIETKRFTSDLRLWCDSTVLNGIERH